VLPVLGYRIQEVPGRLGKAPAAVSDIIDMKCFMVRKKGQSDSNQPISYVLDLSTVLE
jgi:hypothetical protein